MSTRFTRRIFNKQTLMDKIVDLLQYNIVTRFIYNVKFFCSKLPLFIKLCYNWSANDFDETLVVVKYLLIGHAKFIRNGWNLNSEKYYRRAMTAAGMIDKVVNPQFDKTVNYCFTKLRKNGGLLVNDETQVLSDEDLAKRALLKKIANTAIKRVSTNEDQLRNELFDYLKKHSRNFWD